uniref:Uncharacterized protein n=1 Tax=Salix viminalis TaxID=40686 RepID=A0A6N2NDB2_SALVM
MLFLLAIPAMLLALVLRFDYRKSRDPVNLLDLHSSKGHRYIWYVLPGYAIGLISNCISCWCSDSLTATCSSLSGAFYTRTGYSCVLSLWEGSIMSNAGNDKARQIEV